MADIEVAVGDLISINVSRDNTNPADWEVKRITIQKAPITNPNFALTWKSKQEQWFEDTNPVPFNLVPGQ